MLRWIRGRRELLAELVEAREQCVAMDRLLAVAVKERDTALNDAASARNQLAAAAHQRDDAWKELTAQSGDLIPDYVWDYRPPSPRGALLRERARADQLAAVVDRLQEANMRADCMHDIPTWEGAAAG